MVSVIARGRGGADGEWEAVCPHHGIAEHDVEVGDVRRELGVEELRESGLLVPLDQDLRGLAVRRDLTHGLEQNASGADNVNATYCMARRGGKAVERSTGGGDGQGLDAVEAGEALLRQDGHQAVRRRDVLRSRAAQASAAAAGGAAGAAQRNQKQRQVG